jgi:hypothetical protein
MSIMQKLFGNIVPQAPQAKPAEGQGTGNLNTSNPNGATEVSGVTDPNGVVPKGSADNKGEPAQTPLAKFDKLWEPTPASKDDKNQSEELTPEKLLEAASKVDFTKVLDAGMLAKIQAGGEEAVQALVQALQKTSQQSYGQSIVVANELVRRATSEAEQRFSAQIPNLVKQHTLKDRMADEDPRLTSPAVAPLLQAVQSQLSEKYPQASATEIQKMAKEYLSDVAGLWGKQSKEPPGTAPKGSKSTESQEFNWDEWLAKR